MSSLFDPIKIGEIALANRIVMAPLTRNRAIEGHLPGPMTVEYYRQRASAGLIIAEASQISQMAQGYLDTPGIYSPEQVAAWRKVTDAVHAAGGKIVIQLWHVGRISHSSLLPDGAAPVSSTNRRPDAQTFTREGFVPVSAPRALRDGELPGLIADYRHAARCAIEAGFDGVEVHSANSYLLDQFLRDSVNDRSGPYGGSIANRARLLLEVMRAIADEIDETSLHMSQLLKTKLVDMDLSVRDLNCLKAADVETLGELVAYNKNDLLKFRNFGKKSLTELEELVKSKNLTFGMNVSKYKLDKD